MTSKDQPTPRTIAVFGSCITRDNFNSQFNPQYRRWYSVVAQANQSSVIALMSPPVEPEVTEADGLSEYDTWNVRSDLSRSFLTEVVEARPDYLILDFFGDLHFGVRELGDGRFVTDNRWKLHQTAQYARWNEAAEPVVLRLLDDPDAYFARWTDALDRFAGYLAEQLPETTVIVHRGFYANNVVTGPSGRPRNLRRFARLADLKVRRLNEFWERLDSYAVTTYGWASIDLTHDRYTSTAEHPWGAFWVHYTLDYYRRFLAELHRIDLGLRLSAGANQTLTQVVDAGRERTQTQNTFVRRAIKAQNERVRYLERRGVARTVRDALKGRTKVTQKVTP